MNILFIASDAHGGFGGISQYNRDILRAMSELSHVDSVRVCVRIADEEISGVPAKVSYDYSSVGGVFNFFRSSVANAIRKKNDVVYCAHVNLLPFAVLAKIVSRSKLILAIYGIDVWDGKSALIKYLIKNFVDEVASISQVTVDRCALWAELDPARVSILPNAIDLQHYTNKLRQLNGRSALGEQYPDNFFLMTMGRLVGRERAKGFDEIVELLPSLIENYPKLMYAIVGDGPDKSRLIEKCSDLGLEDRVVFTGRIPEEEKVSYLSSARLFVMPSKGEGFGFVILEALACGVPVVASIDDGTREAVLGGELGKLVDPNSPEAIKSGIIEALEEGHPETDKLSFFDFPNFTSRVNQLLRKVVAGA